jgi:hypothetical protein
LDQLPGPIPLVHLPETISAEIRGQIDEASIYHWHESTKKYNKLKSPLHRGYSASIDESTRFDYGDSMHALLNEQKLGTDVGIVLNRIDNYPMIDYGDITSIRAEIVK